MPERECRCGKCGATFTAAVQGKHKILCASSTDEASVRRVMGTDKRAVVAVTDPPYSVNYEQSHMTRGGDATVHGAYHEADIDPTALLAFLAILPADVIVFSYPADRHLFALADKLREYGWEVRKQLVWVKNVFSFWPGAAYQQKHEPIWICTRNGASFRGNVPANETTVLEYDKPVAHKLHPTAKPLDLWMRLIQNHSDPGDLIFEPFSGSGTSCIGAHRLGRRSASIELSPQYVEVLLKRAEAESLTVARADS